MNSKSPGTARGTKWCCAGLCVLLICLSAVAARPAGAKAGAPFTIVLLPDTQHYSRKYPELFMAQTEWIKANRDKGEHRLRHSRRRRRQRPQEGHQPVAGGAESDVGAGRRGAVGRRHRQPRLRRLRLPPGQGDHLPPILQPRAIPPPALVWRRLAQRAEHLPTVLGGRH